MDTLNRFRQVVLGIANKLSWLGPGLARLTVGLIFIGTGWGKLHNLSKVTEFFSQLQLPAPGFTAAVVGTSELLCGALLLVGLIARLAALPLIVVMIVAIATAKSGELGGFLNLLHQQEFDYLVLLVWIAIAGAGAASVDHFISRRLEAATTRGAVMSTAASTGRRA